MMLNEEQILSNKFVFVSYSHKDIERVKQDMEALLSRGVRVWYDEHMRLGDRWTEVAARTIQHENCVGVLFYNSPDSFVSAAVQREQRMAAERCSKENFRIWAVHLGAKPTAEIIKAATMLTPDFESYMEIMDFQRKLFSSECLCILSSDSADTVGRIYVEIAEPYNIVDNENNFLDVAKKSGHVSRAKNEITFGRYISSLYYGPEQPNGTENQRFGTLMPLIQLDGKRYNTKDLTWELLYVKDGRAIMLCTQILAQMTFDEGKNFLEDIFPSLAFTESDNETDRIIVRYMNLEDVEQAQNANNESALKLSAVGEFKHWWIDEQGMTEYWKQTYSDDCAYTRGFNSFFKKGVRPVIEISTKYFK